MFKSAHFLFVFLFLSSMALGAEENQRKGRLVMFIGVDISSSFMNTPYFEDSLEFLANYLYAHITGTGDLERPHSLFVGSIGGAREGEMKTFFPIQAFENKSISAIHAQLREMFPKKIKNPFTDYNAFFKQVAYFVEVRKLQMRPISILLLSDGVPDANGRPNDYRGLNVKPLENLTRNLTIRLLYSNAVVSANWQTKLPRQRVKVWTQDAAVMRLWRAENIFRPGVRFENQDRFFSWIRENVDFNVRVRRVD